MNLDRITSAAVKDMAYREASKAIARTIILEGKILGNKPEEKITRMDAEIAVTNADLPLRTFCKSMAALHQEGTKAAGRWRVSPSFWGLSIARQGG